MFSKRSVETDVLIKKLLKCAVSGTGIHEEFKCMLKQIAAFVRASAGSLLLLMDDGSLQFVAVYGGKEGIIGERLPPGSGIAGVVAESLRPIISNNPSEDERWAKEFAVSIGYIPENILAVPVMTGNKIVGVLEVLNKHGGFKKEDLKLISSVIPILSSVVEKVRLYYVNQKEIERLRALIDISLKLGGMLDLQTLLEGIMETAKEALDAEASSIFMIDKERNDLYFVAATGEKKESLKEIRVPWGKGIVGWVAEHGRTLYVPDVSKDERFYSKVDEKTKFITKSIIAVPLWKKSEIIGVAEVLNKKGGGTFTVEDITVFEAIAKHASIAIENASLYKELEDLFRNAIMLVVNAIEAKDPYTKGHTARVTKYSMLIARTFKMSAEQRRALELAALLHDVGKIGIPDSVLLKPGKLTEEEYALIKEHPSRGAKIMEPLKIPEVIEGILHHHEKYDGSGYPDGIKNGDIPFNARIIAVADAFDAMTTDRPYRKGLPLEEAIRRLKKDSGTHFDPEIVQAFLDVLEVRREEIIKTISS